MGARSSRDSDGNEDQPTVNENVNSPANSNRTSADLQEAINLNPVALEPRRHQGERGVDILNVLEHLYRSGELRVMPGRRGVIRYLLRLID
jgi:hypothetical protein